MEKGYIKIANAGEIELNAFRLLGATNKRGDDSKIGFFGSGLKYALAVLLREEVPFKVFSGLKEVKITVKKEKFRGQEVGVIKINGTPTSLTTDMGPTWEPWFAIREVYCNAVDEGGHELGVSGEAVGVKGQTVFYVENVPKLHELFANWNKYFSDKRTDIVVDSKDGRLKAFPGSTDGFVVYRKGIRCYYEQKRKSLYHYDVSWVKINESRVIENSYSFNLNLAQAWGACANVSMIRNYIDNYKGTYEETFDWSCTYAFNEDWLKAIDGRKLVIDSVAGYFIEEIASQDTIQLPISLVESLKNYFGEKIQVLGKSTKRGNGEEVPMNDRAKADIDFAIDFLKKAGVEITAPITLWEFDDHSTLGEAKNGTIKLSPSLFKQGRREVVATIMEEYAHLDSGAADKTRAFQSFLINEVINQMERNTGLRV